jgi:hypothetical protein
VLLEEASRHFRRARSEVWEAVLLRRLDALREILNSLRKEPQFRIAKAEHYMGLQEAFDRGIVAGCRAREAKATNPDRAVQEAKKGIGYVQFAIDAFMKKAGEFELASEVRSLSHSQRRLLAEAATGTRLAWLQIFLALVLFVGGILFQRYLLE